jgi:hypothetical protein
MTDIKTLNQLVFEWVGRREFDKTHVHGCIADNLNPNFPMRPYQHKAFQYFLNYWQEPFDGKPWDCSAPLTIVKMRSMLLEKTKKLKVPVTVPA